MMSSLSATAGSPLSSHEASRRPGRVGRSQTVAFNRQGAGLGGRTCRDQLETGGQLALTSRHVARRSGFGADSDNAAALATDRGQ